ncbi:MAG: protein kinase [Gemmatimonadetes bacterium]|nr:protein kinase [Gemmatimonadota bacterium]
MSESSAERFRQADALFDAVLDLPIEEHEAFLARAGDGDVALQAEVRRLLAAYRASGDFLESPSAPSIAPLLRSVWGGVEPPQRIGPFRIIREVGRGGMGTVYLAERDDGQFEQRVALKLVRPIGRTDALVARFLGERRILARLRHRHIASLIDGGVMDDGTPWFAMEFVDGQRLDSWCDAAKLPIGRRVALLESVCAAVQYAHEQLVVHRDLKPSNILVTPNGELKLLDFGIAKLLGAEADVTETQTMAMTPQYAAPEQVRGEPASAATDVYALGVLAYEQLTGRRPYDLAGRAPAEVVRLICEVDPPRPSDTFVAPARGAPDDREQRARSRGASPDRLRRALRGDLDAIVMKALRKEPARRYPSAAALLDDLHRLRDGRPVMARPDGTAYRLRRFVRRHAAAMATAAMLVVLLVGGLLRERTLRTRAEGAARTAQAVEDYMVRVFDVADPFAPRAARGEDVTARALLDQGVARIDRELAAQPELQPELRSAFARVYANLGLFDRAARQSRRALSQLRTLHGPKHPDVAATLDALGSTLYKQNNFDEAEPLLREALVQRRALFGAAAPTATTLDHLASLLQEKGALAPADTLFREALAIRRRLATTEQDSIALSNALNNLAVLLFVKGAYDDAAPLYRESLAISVRLLGENHPTTAMTVQNLAQVQQFRGKLDEAETLYRRALDAKRRALGDAHPSVTLSMNNLGSFLVRERGKPDEADSLFRAAIALDRRTFGDKHGYVAAGLNNLATAERMRGRFEEATRLAREAVAIAKDVYPGANKETAAYLSNLGGSLYGTEDLDGAVDALRASVAQYRQALGEKHPFTQTVAVNLGRALYDRASLPEAERLFRGATEALDSLQPSNRTAWIAARVGVGRVMAARGQARDAIPMLERAASASGAQSGATHWRTAEAHVALGEALIATGAAQRAEPILEEAVRVLEPQAKAQPRLFASARRALDAARRRLVRAK